MTKFRLSFKASVAKDLRQIPKHDVQSILQRIERLADDPRPNGSEKLSGQERYRVRQGTYRIVYEIREQELVVMVVKIGHRRDVYRFL
jgi:mRNA interferase RelE/StbE